jgi:hypothetical protein
LIKEQPDDRQVLNIEEHIGIGVSLESAIALLKGNQPNQRARIALDRPLVPAVREIISVRWICDYKMHTLIWNSFQDVHAVAPDDDVFLHHVVRRRNVFWPGEDQCRFSILGFAD